MTDREFLKMEVLRLLNENLIPFGYKLSKSACDFTKKTDFGWNKYQIVFLIQDSGWEIKPSLLMRFDIVENLFHQISDFEKKYQKGTPTIGTSIEDLGINELETRFELSNKNKIEGIVNNLVELFKSVVLPFFAKYSNLHEVDKLLNGNVADTSMTGDIFKGTKSLIIAKLLNRNDLLNLERTYQTFYENFSNGFYLPEYIRLKKYLLDNA